MLTLVHFNLRGVVISFLLGMGVTIRLLLDIIDATFDVPSAAAAMKDDVWKLYVYCASIYSSMHPFTASLLIHFYFILFSCLEYIDKVLKILYDNPTIEMSDTFSDDEINYIVSIIPSMSFSI